MATSEAATTALARATYLGETVEVICGSCGDMLIREKSGREHWVPVMDLWWEGEALIVPSAESLG